MAQQPWRSPRPGHGSGEHASEPLPSLGLTPQMHPGMTPYLAAGITPLMRSPDLELGHAGSGSGSGLVGPGASGFHLQVSTPQALYVPPTTLPPGLFSPGGGGVDRVVTLVSGPSEEQRRMELYRYQVTNMMTPNMMLPLASPLPGEQPELHQDMPPQPFMGMANSPAPPPMLAPRSPATSGVAPQAFTRSYSAGSGGVSPAVALGSCVDNAHVDQDQPPPPLPQARGFLADALSAGSPMMETTARTLASIPTPPIVSPISSATAIRSVSDECKSAGSNQSRDSDVNSDASHIVIGLGKQRLVWTTELHQVFLDAIHQVGLENAVPRVILEKMNVPGLRRENVSSHLQKYRLALRRQLKLPKNAAIPHGLSRDVIDNVPLPLAPTSEGGRLLRRAERVVTVPLRQQHGTTASFGMTTRESERLHHHQSHPAQQQHHHHPHSHHPAAQQDHQRAMMPHSQGTQVTPGIYATGPALVPDHLGDARAESHSAPTSGNLLFPRR